MKRLHIFIGLLLVLLMWACTSDNYDTGDGKYSYMRAEFVDAHANADKRVDNVETDGGEWLAVERPFTTSWITRGDSVYRALLYYNKVGNAENGYMAQPIAVERVPVADLVSADELNSVKTDPLVFESLWLSANRKYVNIGFAVKTGNAGDQTRQTVMVVAEGISKAQDGRRVAELRLYHDQGGVPEYYSSHGYISIKSERIDAQVVRLRVNTYSGEVVKEIDL